jgi:hypothetical protein
LDQFSIGGIFFLVAFFVWDGIVGSQVLTTSTDYGKRIEMAVLIIFAALFILFLVYIIFCFARIEFQKKKFQKDSHIEWLELQKQKSAFKNDKSDSLAKKGTLEEEQKVTEDETDTNDVDLKIHESENNVETLAKESGLLNKIENVT